MNFLGIYDLSNWWFRWMRRGRSGGHGELLGVSLIFIQILYFINYSQVRTSTFSSTHSWTMNFNWNKMNLLVKRLNKLSICLLRSGIWVLECGSDKHPLIWIEYHWNYNSMARIPFIEHLEVFRCLGQNKWVLWSDRSLYYMLGIELVLLLIWCFWLDSGSKLLGKYSLHMVKLDTGSWMENAIHVIETHWLYNWGNVFRCTTSGRYMDYCTTFCIQNMLW